MRKRPGRQLAVDGETEARYCRKTVETATVTKKDLDKTEDEAEEKGSGAIMQDGDEVEATIITGEALNLPSADEPGSPAAEAARPQQSLGRCLPL